MAATVAQLRGAKFDLRDGYYHPEGAIKSPDADTAFDAVSDVARWLGFRGRAEFYLALEEEGSKILDRVKR